MLWPEVRPYPRVHDIDWPSYGELNHGNSNICTFPVVVRFSVSVSCVVSNFILAHVVGPALDSAFTPIHHNHCLSNTFSGFKHKWNKSRRGPAALFIAGHFWMLFLSSHSSAAANLAGFIVMQDDRGSVCLNFHQLATRSRCCIGHLSFHPLNCTNGTLSCFHCWACYRWLPPCYWHCCYFSLDLD